MPKDTERFVVVELAVRWWSWWCFAGVVNNGGWVVAVVVGFLGVVR